jgi:hypothetical protein
MIYSVPNVARENRHAASLARSGDRPLYLGNIGRAVQWGLSLA